MKLIIFYAILILIAFLFISKVQINFHPFKIVVSNWIYGIGWLLFMSGLITMLTAKSTEEYSRGFEKGQKMMIDKLDEGYIIISKETIENLKTKDTNGSELK